MSIPARSWQEGAACRQAPVPDCNELTDLLALAVM